MNVAFMFLQSIFAFESFSTALCFAYEPGISFTRFFMLFKTVHMKDSVKQEETTLYNLN